MSQENVEIVRRLYAEWQRGNFAPTELLDPDLRITWLDVVDITAGAKETVGLEAASAVMRGWLPGFADVSLIAEKVIDAGNKVVVIGVWRGHGRVSGALTEWRHGTVFEIGNAKVARMTSYRDPSDALEAAGLEE